MAKTTAAYKKSITAAFANANLPNGSSTTPAYKQTLTDAFRTVPGAEGYVAPEPPPDPYAAAKSQFKGLMDNAKTGADATYKGTLADSIAGEGTFALDYGATLGSRDGLDPSEATSGSFDWNGVEATNPFSKAALLVRSYNQQKNRTTNGMASAGQLYSGAIQNARSQDTFGYQQGQDALNKAMRDYLTGGSRTRRDALGTRDKTINDAGLAGLGTLIGS